MTQLRFSLSRHTGDALWLLVGAAVTAKVLVKGDERSVYPIFATATHNWWAGISMYQEVGETDLYRYSPVFSVFFTPFAMHETWSHISWILASMALMYYACRQFYAELIKPQLTQETDGTLNLFLLLVGLTFVRSVWQGQSNILLMAMILLALVALMRGRSWRAAFFLTATIFIKIWPIALVLLLATKRWRLIPQCLVIGLVLAALPFLTQPPDIVLDQYNAWFRSLILDQGRRTSYRDFWTLWELFGGIVNPMVYHLAQLGSGLVIFALSLVVLSRPGSEASRLFLILSLWVCWQLQIGPGTERMTYSIFAPVIAGAVLVFRDKAWWLLVTSLVLLGIFTHGSLERVFLKFFPAAEVLIVMSATTYFLWLVWYLLACRPDPGAGAQGRPPSSRPEAAHRRPDRRPAGPKRRDLAF
ncbi:MAG: glycosyltransferase family 87 protein [Pseudomonadota bacterium]